jgi:imidazolonepropionase-like amidohydrolase
MTILRTATTHPSDVFGFDHVGLDRGDQADFVLWPENPLEDVAVYRRPVGVFTQGIWRDAPELDDIR